MLAFTDWVRGHRSLAPEASLLDLDDPVAQVMSDEKLASKHVTERDGSRGKLAQPV